MSTVSILNEVFGNYQNISKLFHFVRMDKYILYPLDLPEVRPLTYRVYSGVGQATQLSCRVMGYPQPVVSWFFLTERGRQYEVRHDTMHTYSTDGNVHTLTISHLAHNQLTNFTCRAQNEVGFNQGHIEVTGNGNMLLIKIVVSIENYRNLTESDILQKLIVFHR